MSEDKPKYTYKIRQKRLSQVMYEFFNIANNLDFIIATILAISIAYFITQDRQYVFYARWFGFFLSCYGLISNDSIQTLGVFITANAHRTKWWILWLFVSILFIMTVGISWLYWEQNVTYDRLSTDELNQVTFWQLVAPISLIILTRLGLPVSTTFLLLSTFVTQPNFIQKVICKSALGYIVSFISGFLVWFIGFNLTKRDKRIQEPSNSWFIVQWGTSGLLWCIWLMQDGANMAIFLPHQMNLGTFVSFTCFVSLLLMMFFYKRGGNIQKVVNSKTGITDTRAASFVNGFYMLLLFFFTIYNNIPISTTWLFIGLLGGRELATSFCLQKKNKTTKACIKKSIYLIGRDLLYALIGLGFSIGLSFVVKPSW